MATWEHLRQLAESETRPLLRQLPSELQAAAGEVTVIFERTPDDALIADGVEPDVLGLFDGPDYGGAGDHGVLPPRIFLFLTNLWSFAGGDETQFRAEVRTTYLHELGHYLGLDEDDLFDRGLD